MSFPYVLYCTPEGEIREDRSLQALSFDGHPLRAEDLIPLPDGVTLSMMPDRLAVGLRKNGERKVLPQSRGWALAALLPIGYTRTLLPAYEKIPNTEPLPFFGYSAVAGLNGRQYVAAVKTDDPYKWHPRSFPRRKLERLVREKLRAYPENRVIKQHAHCALDYSCPTASNLFFSRWEMAIAVSPGCNARCVGCISKQEEEELISPQDRLTFIPTVEEIVEVAVPHLESAPDAIVSFGQGCEGEPLLQFRRIEQAIKGMRARTDKGVININTNGSRPRWLQKLYDAGLDTIRVSTISAHPETYTAYYRPLGYTFEDIKESLIRARDAGLYTSINLLCFPGMIDREREVESLLAFVRETKLCLIQLRNLNIDPEVLLPRMPALDSMGKALGMKTFLEVLRREVPEVELGNFTRPIQRPISSVQA
ncbi:radical SAM family protein [Thermosporothrix hazakensis]|jgi:pyruvate-formate lyase-activating enzyme|uniref:Radical SAM family protein n=1 Tax=Thermosporothrix hazakensis TaxID=644383 RepID=A0A326UEJ6_THEHA|nr:radical SAM protein [Thermosporothrix hazakensis]PZW36464.1 radical SAM family protein [Thermosporothrix hazakensis]GCE47119.1 radical SAM protein [Thermosporothrix hazakensis]